MERSFAARRLQLFGVWTFLGVFFASQAYLWQAAAGSPITWGAAFSSRLSYWYGWAFVSPLVFALARRFRPSRGRWLPAMTVHVTASILLAPLQATLSGVLQLALGPLLGVRTPSVTQLAEFFKLRVLYRSFDAFAFYWVLLVVFLTVTFYRKFRERELRASILEAQLAHAELQVLRMQLHPHFLFNTLHAITVLMHRDLRSAEKMLFNLSSLLRQALDSSGRQEVPLQEELEFLERYLEIEQTRFGERLVVDFDVAPEALQVAVPNLVLQPLVENAIHHAVAPRPGGGRIEIRAALDTGALRLEVGDDGPGLPEGQTAFSGKGVGLANTQARLAQLYGGAHRFELGRHTAGGLSVNLTIPARIITGRAASGGEGTQL